MREGEEQITTHGARRLWELPCVAIKVFLTYGMRPDTLRALVRSHVCDPCAPNLDNDAWVLRLAHQACHSQNRLSERVEAQLHVRFRIQIGLVRESTYLGLVRQLTGTGLTPFELAGVFWALQTDAAAAKRGFGENLMKTLVAEQIDRPANIVAWPGKIRPVMRRNDRHRWN